MKLYSLIFALIVGLTITACGNGSTTTTETNDTTTTVVEDTATTLIDSTEVDSSEVLLDSIVN